jgi:4'-phosphopantetheinyl transferase
MILQAELVCGVRSFSWPLSPFTLGLSSHDVDIWLAELNSITMHVQQMAQCLYANEHLRAERFHFKRDKRRFIVRRAVLKMILGRYLQIEPHQIQFTYGTHGKPFLAEKHGDSTLRFNLAHSNEAAIYAFMRGREIGVDVEYIRTLPDAGQIAD